MALTQTQLADAIAEKADLTRGREEGPHRPEEVILEQIGEAEKVKIGGVVQLTVCPKPARPARPGRNPPRARRSRSPRSPSPST